MNVADTTLFAIRIFAILFAVDPVKVIVAVVYFLIALPNDDAVEIAASKTFLLLRIVKAVIAMLAESTL